MWLKIGFCFWILSLLSMTTSAEPYLSAAKLRQSALNYQHTIEGVRNDAKAYRLYCLASALGDRIAMYQLGWMYFNGRGVPRDLKLAMGWFHHAAARRERYALRMVKRFGSIPSREDQNCPIIQDPRKMTRAHIRAWAKLLGTELGVDPRLVMAVIKTESNFNPAAHSPAHAYGLMQLMATTAKRFSVNRLHPVENMIGGILYLRWLLRHFRGNVSLALAAYNAGEDAVKRHHGIPPYKETQRYVRKILTEYRHTRHPIPKTLSF